MGKRKRSDRNAPHWAPCYWPSWLAVGLTWILAKIPAQAQHALCRALATLLAGLRLSRGGTIHRNLELCFPEMSDQQRRELAKANLTATLATLFDLVNLTWKPAREIYSRTRVEGREHLDAALAADKPLLLLGAHFTSFIGGIIKVSELTPFNVVYRRMDNPVLEQQLYRRAAAKYPIKLIHRKEIRNMLASLSGQGVVMIVPDQDFGPKRSSFIPFFGISTATITAIPQYAATTGANVLTFETYPDEQTGHSILKINPVMENFPSGDDLADTQRWSDWLETAIRRQPENYFWLHKRFKTRPAGEKKIY